MFLINLLQVLTSHQWLQLFDNILSNEPSFIIFAVVSYNILFRSVLLSLKDINDFEVRSSLLSAF